jgi:small subunit ribosomal protein S11
MAAGKKVKKVISDGIAHIHASFNNTIITITDKQGMLFAGLPLAAPVFVAQEKAHHLLLR